MAASCRSSSGLSLRVVHSTGLPPVHTVSVANARRSVRRCVWTLSVMLWAVLPSSPRAEQALLRGYGQPEGLDNLLVSSVAQDGEGYLWAGTDNGLYRFDGLRFQRAAPDELAQVDTVLADPLGGLWVATPSGLYHWQDGALRPVGGRGQPSPAVDNTGNMAADRAGSLWILGGGQLYEVRRSPRTGEPAWQVRQVLGKPAADAKPPRLFSLAVTRDGSVWVGCEYSLCRLEGSQLRPFAAGTGSLSHQIWTRLLADREGSLWLRSAGRLARLAQGADELVDMGLPAAAAGEHGPSHPLAEDAQGRILTGGSNALARLDPARPGSPWELFDRPHGMPPGGRFLTVFADREAGVWLSRGGSGLWQWVGYGHWEHWTQADGLPHDVVWQAVRDSEGVLHVATNAGVAVFDEPRRRFATSPGTAGLRTMALHADATGQVWASALGQVLRRAPAPGKAFATAARSEGWNLMHNKLVSRHDGSLWFSGSEGVGWWAGVGNRGRLGPPEILDGLASDLCVMPTGAAGEAIWVSTGQGLLRGDEAEPPRPALPGSFAQLSCGHDGVLYASDEHQHLFRIDTSASPPRMVDITPPVLARRQVVAMLADRRGWLWVNTDAGVAAWNGHHWRLLDQAQGLVWNDTSGAGLFEDRDGTIWISTSQGLSHLLDPESVFEPTLPALRIRSVVQGGEPRPTEGPLGMKWSRAEALEVAVESPSYRDRPSQSFEHRLLGFDERWQPTGGSVIRYAGLPAGSYTLQARLVDRQLGLSSPSVELRLEIEPPWWQTWAFRLLAGTALAGLAYLGHRWRLQAARRREHELAALVAERTRELEASREELRERATKDGLTGAWNRRTVLEMLEQDVERCARDGQPLTVVLADIDHFKRINDELGHPAGDEVLRQFVGRLRAVVRPYDAVGRYGGEEFVVLLRGLGLDQPEDRARVEAIRAAVADGPMLLGHGMQREVTCSFGAACARADSGSGPEDLIRQADEALYRAKRAGRNRVEYAGIAK